MPSKDVNEPLYVSRAVMNGEDIVEWARSQGISSMLYPDDLHVTICYSKEPLHWSDVPDSTDEVVVRALDDFPEDDQPVRKMEMFGKDKNVLVIQLESDELFQRWQEFCDHGASYDFPEYKPHITITYKGAGLEEAAGKIEPYRGEIVLGPERFKKIDKTWAGDAPEIDLQGDEPLPFEMAEGVEYSDGTAVILRDPTADQVRLMRSRCDEEGIAAILADDLYVWEAAHMTHSEAKRILGLSYGENLYLGEDAPFVVVGTIGFEPGEYGEHDTRWFQQAHREMVECFERLEDDTVMRRLYGDVEIKTDNPQQWSDLCEFVSSKPLLEYHERDYSNFGSYNDAYGTMIPPSPESLGREPPKPRTFFGYVLNYLQDQSRKLGVPVRISAEQAESEGVQRDYIFFKSGALKAPGNKIFSSKYGSLYSREVKRVSLDWDFIDPEQWGLPVGQEIEPSDIAELLNAAFEGREESYDRYDPRYHRWMTWQWQMDEASQFYDEYGDENGNLLPPHVVRSIMAGNPPIDLPYDEVIDNDREPPTGEWIPPQSDDEEPAGPERFDEVPPRLHESRSEMAGGIRVTVNPSADELLALAESFELAGVTDGKHVYVWPSAAGSHTSVMEDLQISLSHLPSRFYAFLPEMGQNVYDLQARMGRLALLENGVVIGAAPLGIAAMRRAPVAECWFSGREPLVETRAPLARIEEEIEEAEEPEPVTEATNDPLPKKFWLVFDVPASKPYDDAQLAKFEAKLQQIGQGHLKGIRGISDTREIVTGWFLMCRNAVAVMDPAAVAAVNDISKVQYDDPDGLCRDNFANLYRIWDKEDRTYQKPNHAGLMQNVLQYTIAAVRKQNDYLAHLMSGNNIEWKCAKLWDADPTGVNDVASAGRKVFELISALCAEEKYYGYARIADEMTPEVIVQAVRDALLYVGQLYSDEGEWIVSSDGFTIPPNSILMIGINPEVAKDYAAWLDDPESQLKFKINNYSYENHHRLMKAIEDYGLRDRYALRFVDGRKFEAMRGDIITKRRKGKLGESEREIRLPLPGETPFWVEDLAPLTEQLVSDDWGWTEGGCWAFAYALKAAIGGTLAGICEKDMDDEDAWGTHHAMILKNGVYYDYTGVVDVQKWLSQPGNDPAAPKKVMTERDDYFEAYQDEFLDDDQYKFLFRVLRQLKKPRKPRG